MTIGNLNPPDPDNLPVDTTGPEELPAEHHEVSEGERVAPPAEFDDESYAEPESGVDGGVEADQES